MSDRYTLIAFLSTLIAIVVLVLAGAIMAINGRPAEALGIGGAVTGLIGVIGTFKPRTPDIPGPTGTATDPLTVVAKKPTEEGTGESNAT